ncbi:MAG TPA: YbbR-like domain-containing protein [Desulfobulbus sp.]|nr:YbbR-like domain-containing protein [Desulfobulbus sp.]
MEKLARLNKGRLNSFLSGIHLKEWALKALSLCLAVFLWYFVVGEDQVDINISVPIEALNLPPDLVISNQYKKDIEASIRGPRSIIKELRNQTITRPVDLSKAVPGTMVIKNEADSIPFPNGITVLRLQPANTTLLIDKLIRKDLPIHPVIEGEPLAGYKLTGVKIKPEKLMVSGPKNILDAHLALKTYVINLDGLSHSTTLQVQLNLSPEMLNLIGETIVSVEITVAEQMLKKTVRGIPVNVRDADVPVKTIPGTVAVEAEIPENLIRDTPELVMLFRASVEAKDIQLPKQVQVNVTGVSVPNHAPVKIIAIKPETVLLQPQQQPRQKNRAKKKPDN